MAIAITRRRPLDGALTGARPTPERQRVIDASSPNVPLETHRRRVSHDAESTRALLVAHEQELRRVARDLHDVVGQALTGVKLDLEGLRREPGRRSDAAFRRSIAIVDQAMRDVRDLAIQVRPSVLDDLGLEAAIRWYVPRQGRLAGYRTSLALGRVPKDLDDEVASACFRILQEASTNIARHAGARQVRVELRVTDAELVLSVDDDGVGFVPTSHGRRGRQPRLGLLGMAERAATIGGSLEIVSTPGQGTRVLAHLPLEAQLAHRRAS